MEESRKEITVDNIRDAVRKMNEMAIPRKVQEDLLLSQELYDQLKEHARQFVPDIYSMTICTFEGIVVRVDPDLKENEYRWDDSKAKEAAMKKLMEDSEKEIITPWYSYEEMKMWQTFFGRW